MDVDAQPKPNRASAGDAEWQCCFCGQRIREPSADVAITHADGAAQGLRAHIRCLRDRLHPSVPFLDADDEATPTA